MTDRDRRIFREDNNISYKGCRIPRRMRIWAERKLCPEFLKNVGRARYKTPSPIQMAVIPLSMQHRDVIGIAQTGSGKTVAFVLPMLTYIARTPPITEEQNSVGGRFSRTARAERHPSRTARVLKPP
ncbi:P-loop containing nucleoside triphosphate hydrolases superfamily protein [Perilla frutescens var. hirtella]|nr:P-loop containing nucleoside triphosphate hydrolases superfamily protein [Perilla frutescens var. hirtella]